MHPKAADEVVKLCRRRSEGGDCPAETPASIETLEETILELDRRLQLQPDPECEAGILHWGAPNNEIESLRAHLEERDGTLQFLQNKLTETEKDAKRYRWLRLRVPGSSYRIMGIIYSEGEAGVDEQIDAAIAKQKG